MKAKGNLIGKKVLIKKEKDIDRLHNKSCFGKIDKNKNLKLTLLEAFFLKVENKITIYNPNNEKIKPKDLLKMNLEYTSNFLARYLVFKDFRKRGYNPIIEKTTFDIIISKKEDKDKKCFVKIFYEEEKINFKKIQKLNKKINKDEEIWFAILDEEEDITYYKVEKINPKGKTHVKKSIVAKAILLDKRALIMDEKKSKFLHKKEFYGKYFREGLQLSLLETLYLKNKNVIKVIKKPENKKNLLNLDLNSLKKNYPELYRNYQVFSDLKERGLIVKTGFKYGAPLRAYTQKPDGTHAEYIINIVNEEADFLWFEISRGLRLSQSVNKKILYALPIKNSIIYINLKRFRP